MNIGIIGQGFVGKSIKTGLEQTYTNINTYDLLSFLSSCNSIEELVKKSDIIFICVPTPMKKNGECYIGITEKVINEINNTGAEKIIILKTTIPPGTTDYFQNKYSSLKFVFNPEFLTEANAEEDFKNQNRIILGGNHRESLELVAHMYKRVFSNVPIILTTAAEAEMVKYVTNTFLSTKVIFANEIYQICQKLNINYNNVLDAAKLDIRLGNSHWNVPGPDGDFGFGGHCFPKDINALKFLANTNGIETHLLDAVINKNNIIRKNRNWETQIGRSVI